MEVLDQPTHSVLETEATLYSQIAEGNQMMVGLRQLLDICIEFLRGNQASTIYQAANTTATGNNIANILTNNNDDIPFNDILPIRNNVLSRMAVAYPSMNVLPTADVVDDEMKMKASQVALRDYWQAQKMKVKLGKTAAWLVDGGYCALHPYYNPGTGNVESEVVSPYNVVWQKGLSDPDDAEWWMIRRFTTRRLIEMQYPEKTAAIEANAATNQSTDAYRIWGPNSHPQDRVEVWEVYTAGGERLVMLGSFVLWRGRWTTSRIPFQFIRCYEVSGYLRGIGVIEPIIAPQLMANKFRTQIMKNARKMANFKWAIPRESGVSPDDLTSDTGEKVDFMGGHPPMLLQPGPLPEYFTSLPATLVGNMQTISSMPSIALGHVQNAKSGVMVDALTSNALSPLQIPQANIEAALVDHCVCVLELMQQNYTESRWVQQFSSEGEFLYQELNGTAFFDRPQVYLEAGSLFQDNVETRRKTTADMLQAGMISAEEAKRRMATNEVSGDMVQEMMALRRAKQMMGACIVFGKPLEQLTVLDDVDALFRVFKEFVHSPEFYQVNERAQNATYASYQQLVQAKLASMQPQQATGPGAAPAPGGKGMVANGAQGLDPNLTQPPSQAMPPSAGGGAQ